MPNLIGRARDGARRTDNVKYSSSPKYDKYMVCISENMVNIWSVSTPHITVRKHYVCGGGWEGLEGQKVMSSGMPLSTFSRKKNYL